MEKLGRQRPSPGVVNNDHVVTDWLGFMALG